MKVVFLAGPYRDPRGPHYILENILAARAVAVELWQMGYAVLCPHLCSFLMDGACPDEVWLAGALEMMRRCDLVVTMPDSWRSVGAAAEISDADRCGIPVYSWATDQDALAVLTQKSPPALR